MNAILHELKTKNNKINITQLNHDFNDKILRKAHPKKCLY